MIASKVPFLTFTPKPHTFRDSHFCVPLKHCYIFQAVRFCTKAIILSILETVMTAIIIIYSTNLSRPQRWRDTSGDTHRSFGPVCLFLLVNITVCQTCFHSTFFSGIFLPRREHGWHRWMLSHCCFQARGLSQQQHTQKTPTTQTTGSIQRRDWLFSFLVVLPCSLSSLCC